MGDPPILGIYYILRISTSGLLVRSLDEVTGFKVQGSGVSRLGGSGNPSCSHYHEEHHEYKKFLHPTVSTFPIALTIPCTNTCAHALLQICEDVLHAQNIIL